MIYIKNKGQNPLPADLALSLQEKRLTWVGIRNREIGQKNYFNSNPCFLRDIISTRSNRLKRFMDIKRNRPGAATPDRLKTINP